MNKIKFSHEYLKLPARLSFKAMLLQVLKVKRSELSEAMVNYDVCYPMEDPGEFGEYPLPRGDLILLILKHYSHLGLFTTIRRHTPDKFAWYKSKEGEFFDCIPYDS